MLDLRLCMRTETRIVFKNAAGFDEPPSGCVRVYILLESCPTPTLQRGGQLHVYVRNYSEVAWTSDKWRPTSPMGEQPEGLNL